MQKWNDYTKKKKKKGVSFDSENWVKHTDFFNEENIPSYLYLQQKANSNAGKELCWTKAETWFSTVL